MILKKLIKKMPYLGNLLPVVYLSVSKLGPKFSKRIPAKSVILGDDKGQFGIVVSESELSEANFRFVKYAEYIAVNYCNRPKCGHITKISVPVKRINRETMTEYWLIYLRDGNFIDRGYLFTLSSMNDIAARTDRIQRTVKWPSFFQKLIIKIWRFFGARLEV